MMAGKLRYTLMLRVYGEEKIFGPGIAELLEHGPRRSGPGAEGA